MQIKYLYKAICKCIKSMAVLEMLINCLTKGDPLAGVSGSVALLPVLLITTSSVK